MASGRFHRQFALARIIACALVFTSAGAFAQSGPHALNVSGGLFDANGQPVQRGGINFKLEVRDKTGSCVLYSEVHNGEDLSNTKGQFSLLLGSGTTPQNYLVGGATLDASVFLNRGVTGAFTGCPAGVTLASGDERVIRVYYDLGSGLTAMTPDVPIVSSAYAMVADSLQGKGAADFIQVKDDGSTASLNQVNTEYAFSFTNWPKLKALIDGTSSAYLPGGGTSPLDMNNQRIIRVANPGTSPFDAVNKGYADANIGGRTADFTGVGPAIGDGKTMIWDQAAQKWVAGNPTITGTAGGDLSGSYPNPVIASNAVTTAKVADNAITSAKINTTGVAINRLVATDATTGSTLTYFTCAVGEIMWWTATGWQCTTVAAQAPVKTVAGKTPNAAGNVALNAADISGLGTVVTKDFGSAAGEVPLLDASAKIPAYMLPTGTGTITAVTAVAPVLGGGTSGNVTISLDVGTAANQVVRLNGSAQLPAIDGSLLTGVNASKIGTRAVSSAAPGASQVLGYNATLSQWEPMSAAVGSVTAVVSGTGLVAGTITSAGTINVDVGTTAGQIVQFDGSARYPANDGSLITNVNATKLGTRAVASLAPGASQVLGYNATSSQWEPMTDAGGTMTSVTAGTGLVSGVITTAGTLNVDVGTAAGKIVQLNGSAAFPAIDAGNLYNVNASKLGTRAVSSAAPAGAQVLGYNATLSQWEPMSAAVGSVTSVTAGTGLVAGTITSSGTLNVDVGTGAGKVVQLNGSAQIPAVDGSLLTGVNAAKLGARAVASSSPSANQVLMWNGSQWEPANASSTLSWPLTATPGTAPASAPSYSFTGSTNTGLLSQATGTLALATTGTSRLTIDGAGNVGIGTSVPSQLLELNRARNAPTSILLSNTDAGASSATAVQLFNGSDIGQLFMSGTGAGRTLALQATGPGGLNVDTDTGDQLFRTGATPVVRMAIRNNGLIGIGTQTPMAALDVVGSGTTSALVVPRDVQANRPAANAANGMIRYNTSTNKFEGYENGAWVNMTAAGAGSGDFKSDGSVSMTGTLKAADGTAALPGITFAGDPDTGFYRQGTGSVEYASNGVAKWRFVDNLILSLVGTRGPLIVANGTSAASPGYSFESDTSTGLYSAGVSKMALSTAGTARLTVDAAGNVGIGTVSPNERLEVNGNILTLGNNNVIAGYNGSYRSILGATGSGDGFLDLKDNAGPSSKVYLSTNGISYLNGGKVGIGTATPQAGLDVATTGTLASAIIVPRDSAGNRPTTTVNGMMRYNTSTSKFEAYENGVWTNMIGGPAASLAFNTLTAATGTSALDNTNYGQVWNWSTASTQNPLSLNANGLTSGSLLSLQSNNAGLSSTNGILNVANMGTSTSGLVARIQANSAAGSGLYVLANGNVGIGTNSPTDKLQVNGNVQITGAGSVLRIDDAQAAGGQRWAINGYGQQLQFNKLAADWSYSAVGMVLDSSGRLGIGNSIPQAALDVAITGTNSAIIVPRDSTAARPVANVANGMIRYNTSTNKFEGYENGAWVNITAAGAGSGDFKSDGSVVMTGAIRALGGTAGAPGYSFVGDTDTGTFSSTANTLELATGGTSRMTISPSGYVGIGGVSSPAVPLEVANNAAVSSTDYSASFVVVNKSSTGAQYPSSIVLNYAGTSSGYPVMMVKNARGTQGTPTATLVGDVLGSFGAQGYIGSGWSAGAALQFTASENYAATAAGTDVRFYTTKNGTNSGVERMRLQNDGNLGIGTSTPLAALDVAATGTNSALVIPRDTQANRPAANVANGMIRYNTSTSKFEAYENGAWTNMIAAGGGTTAFPLLASPGTTASTAPSYSFNGATSTGLYSPSAGSLALSTLGTSRFQINAQGNVAIGGTTSSSLLNLQSTGSNPIMTLENTSGSDNKMRLISDYTTFDIMAGGASDSGNSALLSTNGSLQIKSQFVSMNLPDDTLFAYFGTTGMMLSPVGSTSAMAIDIQQVGSNGDGVSLDVQAGPAFGINKVGGNLRLKSGSATGSGGSDVEVFAVGTSGTASALVTPTLRMIVKGASGNVGVGTATPRSALEVASTGTNSALLIPRDTQANRPAANVANGMIRYNTSTSKFEAYENGVWANMIGGPAASLAFNTLTSATGTSALDNANYGQVWNWSTASTQNPLSLNANGLTTGSLLSLNTNNAGLNSTSGILNVANTGTSTSGTVARIQSNSNANSGLTVQANGYVGVGTATPFALLDVSAQFNSGNGLLRLNTNDSGAFNPGVPGYTIQANNAAAGHTTIGMIVGPGGNLARNAIVATRPLTNTGALTFYSDIAGTLTPQMMISNGNVAIGGTAALAALDVASTGTNSALVIPRDTQANRPAGNAANGMMRYNTSTAKFEAYENGAWVNMIAAGGGTTAFPLLASPATTSASAPSYSFSGDANTGFFSQATDSVAVATAGTARMTINSSGNVGIGTSSPSVPLEIVATMPGNLAFPLRIKNLAPSGASSIEFHDSGSSEKFEIGFGNSSFTYPNTAYAWTENGVDFQVAAGGVSTFRVKANGQVGVGTTSPIAVLDVAATGTNSALVVPRDTQGNRPLTNAANGMIRYNTSISKFEAYENGGWTNMIAAGGGTTAFPLIAAPGTTASSAPSYSFTGSTNTGLYSQAANTVALATAGTARLTVTAAGNVGIGITNPTIAALHVAGVVNFDGSVQARDPVNTLGSNLNALFRFKDYNNTDAGLIGYNTQRNLQITNYDTTGSMIFGTNGTARMNIDASGKVGIGLTNQAALLAIQSDNPARGGVMITTSSTNQFTNLVFAESGGAGRASIQKDTNNHLQLWTGTGAAGSETWYNRMDIDPAGNVGIGTNSPKSALDVALSGTSSAIIVPRDTTANRPVTNVANGMLRYNTNTNKFEAYENGGWTNMIAAGGGTTAFPLLASPGTTPSSAPSYSFTGSANTGLHSPAAGKLALVTNGTAGFVQDQNGWVGINTPSPGAQLHVTGATQIDGSFINYDFQNTAYGTSSSSTAWPTMSQLEVVNSAALANSAAGVTMASRNGSGYNYAYIATVAPSTGNAPSVVIGASTATNAYSERLRIDGSGRVGIGTTAPLALLDLSTTGTNSALVVPRDTQANRPAGNVANGMIRYNTSTSKFEAYENGGWVNMIAAGGGTTSFPLLASPAITTASAPSYSFTGDADTGMYSTAANNLVFATGGTARMYLDQNGEVSIYAKTRIWPYFGDSTLGFATNGSVGLVGSGPWQGMTFTNASNENVNIVTQGSAPIQLATWGTTRMTILPTNGNVGIGVSSPAAKLDVAGNVNASGDYWVGGASVLGKAGSVVSVGDIGSNTLSLGLRAGNAERVRVSTSGNVGVGTTSPASALDVSVTGTNSALIVPRDTAANRPAGNVANGMIRYNTSTSKFEAYENGAWANMIGGGSGSFPLLASPGTTPASAPSYSFSGSPSTGLFSQSTDSLSLATAGVSRLDIDSAGKVTINGAFTNGGVYPLTIAANTGMGAGKYLNLVLDNQTSGAWKQGIEFRNNGLGKLALVVDQNGNGTNDFSLYDGVAGQARFLVDATGRFGIGTTSPSAQLHVYGVTSIPMQVENGDPNQYAQINYKSTGIQFGAGVGGGTESTLGVANKYFIYDATNAAVRMVVDNTGNVGIGTTSPSQKLEVNGTIKATDLVLTSDRTLKTNIRPSEGLARLLRLNGVQFDWIKSGQHEHGVIAQDVEEVFPDAVVTDPNTGLKAVKYTSLISPLIESVKEIHGLCEMSREQLAEHDRRISSLEQENAALKKKNADLERRLEAIERALEKMH